MQLTAGGQRLVGIASQMVNLAVDAEAAIRDAQGAPELLRIVATSECVVPRSMPTARRCWCGSGVSPGSEICSSAMDQQSTVSWSAWHTTLLATRR